jgi:nucleotide-binding universal stress UspA family protein
MAKPLAWSLVLCWIAELPGGLLTGKRASTSKESLRTLYTERVPEIERLAKRIESLGVPARMHLEFGNPAQRLVELEQELNIGLVALSTHGRRGLKRLFLGSVADYMVNVGSAPVLTVRSPTPTPFSPL